MARASVGGIVVALLIAAPSLADEAVWVGPATGAWNTPANWSTGVVPGFNTAARIDDNPGQSTRVESRVSVSSVGMLSIDAGDTLAVINSTFGDNRPLLLDGTVSIEGSNAIFGASGVVNPGGEIRLAGTNQTGATFNSSALYNAGNIHGAGVVTLGNSTTTTVFWNESTIRADNATVQLTLTTPGQANLENDGTLAASGGGKLLISRGNSSYDFGVHGGRIEAYPASTVSIGATNGTATAYVEDSVLAVMDDNDPNTATPVFQFNSELKNVTLQGKFAMGGASIIGSLTNQTDLSPSATTITSTGTYHNSLQGDVLLKGGGTISLGASSYALFGGGNGSTTYRLINADNLIHGSGELLVSWYGFTNRATVQADAGQNKELLFYNGFSQGLFINSGVMKATNAGRLRLGYTSGVAKMQNFEGGDTGEIIAGQNSSVLLNNIQIQGGVLRTEGNDPATRGKFIAEAGTVLQDVTLDGTFRLQTLAGVLSTITLTGTLHNPGSLTSRLGVAASTTGELAGGGEIISEAGTFLTLGQFASLINDDNVIHGVGTMTAGSTNTTITNRGTFRAEGGTLAFYNQQTVVNNGLLEAAAGGTLTLPTFGNVINYEGAIGGTIHAAAGGVVNVDNVDGGTLATDGSGVIKTSGFIKDLHNTGNIQALAGTTPQGTIVNDGVISGSMFLNSSYARFEGTGRWEGAAAGIFNGSTVENGPHHAILGVGDIGVSTGMFNVFQNEGTLQTSDVATQSFRIYTGSFKNSGLVHAPTGKSLAINSLFSRVSNSGTLQAEGNMDVTSSAGLYNESGGLIDVRATLTLKETRLRNRVGGTISGNGLISGPMASGPLVVNEGVVSPGPSLATLTIGDDFQQLATGQLKIDVSGGATLTNDLLQINGTASLAGSLLVTHVGSDALVAGNSFTFLAATGGVSGVFGQVTMPALDPSLFWYVDYQATRVRALVADVIPGDFNRNGIVGAEDYVWWRHNGGSAQQYSDWVANFGRTVELGGTMSAAQVPEPAGGLLLLVCGVIVLATRSVNVRMK